MFDRAPTSVTPLVGLWGLAVAKKVSKMTGAWGGGPWKWVLFESRL